ncbi:MAG: hypothetical protein ACHRXM_16515 [Isosphaerales bacterium]
MSNPRKRQKPSLIRRLVYLLVLVSGGSAGVGGWAFKDHPRVQALWTLVTGTPADRASPALDRLLVSGAIDALKPHDDFRRPGIFQVTIKKVELDPSLFKAGRTVDIQTKVHKLGSQGRDTTLWDSRSYGQRLAVVGKDELSAGWPNRPFQVEWMPGELLVLEVSDCKAGLFAQPRRFTLAGSDPAAGEFPLKTGDFPLEPAQKPDPPVDPRISHVVLSSQRAGDLGHQDPTEIAERPIVIK